MFSITFRQLGSGLPKWAKVREPQWANVSSTDNKELDLIKKVSGSQRETILREAFKDLLNTWTRQHDLIFLAEYALKTATKANISVDGALQHELRMPPGYWEATLRGFPPKAWAYKLGKRSAIYWVLDQHKEKKPKDPTIRENFDTFRFADYKEKVIDLLARVTTVSMETLRMVDAIKKPSAESVGLFAL